MEKQIITFSANEQELQKTGGVDCYASNTVAYIEAQFELGENWSGYDSVRAVWFTDFVGGISTVLDSDGTCIVPYEVLTRKSAVKVNLVGSIADGGVLTDRLTTCPVVALTVKCNAKVDGNNTSPITPSQFEQFVAQVIAEVEKVTGMTATAETLPAGSPATARYENGVLYLGIPKGDTGATGATGNGIASVTLNADYTLTITMTDGTSYTTASIRGEKGEKGDTGERGETGPRGESGADGFSPIVTVTEITGGHNVSIEDATQTQTFDVMDGVTPVIPWDSILPTDTASGDIVSITDGQSIIPAKSLKVDIDPIQDLNGYDKPWVGGAGKNKLDVPTKTITYADYLFNQTGLSIPAGTYTISFNGAGTLVSLAVTVANGDLFNRSVDVPYTFTASETIIGMRCYATTVGTYKDFQLESGSSATTYEPYSNICPISGRTEVNTIVSPTTSASDGTTYTTALGQTVYGATLDVVSGVLTVDRAMVDLGTLEWSRQATSGMVDRYMTSGIASTVLRQGATMLDLLSSSFVADNDVVYDRQKDGVMVVLSSTGGLYISASGYTSATAFTEGVSGQTLVYPLATPQTIQLTPQQVQLLLGTNNVWSDSGEVTLVYSADIQRYIEKKLNGNSTN